MDVRFRPLGHWPHSNTKSRRPHYTFRAGWSGTLTLLEDELFRLGARDIVIQVDLREQDIRLDGWPRGDARQPAHPGVVVSFESRHGPLQYATDAYDTYQANIRAVALSLEALRAVDRHGVTRRGEQYTGWKALSSGSESMTVEAAAQFLSDEADFSDHPDLDRAELARQLLERPDLYLTSVYRRAARRHHPDVGGERAKWDRLQNARDVLVHG